MLASDNPFVILIDALSHPGCRAPQERGLEALPASPEAVMAFLSAQARREAKASTLGRAMDRGGKGRVLEGPMST